MKNSFWLLSVTAVYKSLFLVKLCCGGDAVSYVTTKQFFKVVSDLYFVNSMRLVVHVSLTSQHYLTQLTDCFFLETVLLPEVLINIPAFLPSSLGFSSQLFCSLPSLQLKCIFVYSHFIFSFFPMCREAPSHFNLCTYWPFSKECALPYLTLIFQVSVQICLFQRTLTDFLVQVTLSFFSLL